VAEETDTDNEDYQDTEKSLDNLDQQWASVRRLISNGKAALGSISAGVLSPIRNFKVDYLMTMSERVLDNKVVRTT